MFRLGLLGWGCGRNPASLMHFNVGPTPIRYRFG